MAAATGLSPVLLHDELAARVRGGGPAGGLQTATLNPPNTSISCHVRDRAIWKASDLGCWTETHADITTLDGSGVVRGSVLDRKDWTKSSHN